MCVFSLHLRVIWRGVPKANSTRASLSLLLFEISTLSWQGQSRLSAVRWMLLTCVNFLIVIRAAAFRKLKDEAQALEVRTSELEKQNLELLNRQVCSLFV